jgi:hypothetical protein
MRSKALDCARLSDNDLTSKRVSPHSANGTTIYQRTTNHRTVWSRMRNEIQPENEGHGWRSDMRVSPVDPCRADADQSARVIERSLAASDARR